MHVGCLVSCSPRLLPSCRICNRFRLLGGCPQHCSTDVSSVPAYSTLPLPRSACFSVYRVSLRFLEGAEHMFPGCEGALSALLAPSGCFPFGVGRRSVWEERPNTSFTINAARGCWTCLQAAPPVKSVPCPCGSYSL